MKYICRKLKITSTTNKDNSISAGNLHIEGKLIRHLKPLTLSTNAITAFAANPAEADTVANYSLPLDQILAKESADLVNLTATGTYNVDGEFGQFLNIKLPDYASLLTILNNYGVSSGQSVSFNLRLDRARDVNGDIVGTNTNAIQIVIASEADATLVKLIPASPVTSDTGYYKVKFHIENELVNGVATDVIYVLIR